MAGLVLREDRDGLATLTLNRPEKLNSLNVEMFVELRAHVDQIARETDRIGLVVVRGAGKCFSAGHDLADIAKGERPPKPNFQSETIERLADLPQPVISAVHGHCYTGALELALAGDLNLRGRVREVRRHSRTMGADSNLGDEPAAPAARRPVQGA
jgi:enoyl-CoA hydratase